MGCTTDRVDESAPLLATREITKQDSFNGHTRSSGSGSSGQGKKERERERIYNHCDSIVFPLFLTRDNQ